MYQRMLRQPALLPPAMGVQMQANHPHLVFLMSFGLGYPYAPSHRHFSLLLSLSGL